MTTSVAMNEGILPYTVSAPLINPTTTAIKSTKTSAMPSGMPLLTTKPAKKIDVMPIVDEIDMSICPVRITKNSPIAMIEMNDACRSTFMMLPTVRNFSLVTALAATSTTNSRRIIQSKKNARNPPP
ncbi:MAG: hypothetical protein BWY81_00042 [Firmicutes bacterium ADurb.Bin467]|nr:MAG: hypothetical protein BWY81_00042 [Firmicutes bacterium ADurb.Bin467]